ncbi:NAD-dependent protein deacetylase sirtuin-2 [Modicella reniformis]|uniref:NAD-dependent protein deacetylase sirtuin-2 n=1 Tax=Modicella reniformis TaxID=1440133 RepID=A0A9P6MA41_9FUNG|nr:NAD-dependent protein deacetylase sirtuin-2 [Modicella reniformis]
MNPLSTESCNHVIKDGTIDAVAELITAGQGHTSPVLPVGEASVSRTPTLTHYLLPLLAKKKLLLRSYTQNIDSLERLAGLSEDLLVEAHGSFATSKCVQCEMTSEVAWVKKHIMKSEIPYCKRCSGLVKPNITFFGENVPLRFSTLVDADFENCDLLIVLGTSLKVEPFNKLIGKVPSRCPRLLINREKAGQELQSGFDFDRSKDTVHRDALFLGNCDDGVKKLAALCGWEDELQTMYNMGQSQLQLEEEKQVLESKISKAIDQEEDQEEEDESAKTLLEAGTHDSADSLDEITHRFEKSTLFSFSDDFPQSSEAKSLSTTTTDCEETDNSTCPEVKPSNKLEGSPEATVGKETASTSDRSQGKDAKETVTSNNDLSEDSITKDETCTGDRNQQRLGLSMAAPTKANDLDTVKVDSVKSSSGAEAVTVVSVITGVSAEALEPTRTIIINDEVESGEEQIENKGADENTDSNGPEVDPMSGSVPSITPPSQAKKMFDTLSPMISPSGTTQPTLASLTWTDTSFTIAAVMASSQPLFSTCVPMTAAFTNAAATDVAVGGGDSGYLLFNSSQGISSGSSNSSSGCGSGMDSGMDSGDSHGLATRSDGPGMSLQMQRRKRRMDFEGNGCGGMLKNEFRYLRGSGALPPHYLTCGRVLKKRRCV